MSCVRFEQVDQILRVGLNRPRFLNAVNSNLLEELQKGLETYYADESIKVVMLYGEGHNFASGADIKELASFDESALRKFHDLRERTFYLLEKYPVPCLAVIEGYALGTGLELALSCDFRIASTEASFGLPSARLGIVESYHYLARLIRAVGPAQAKKIIFTGQRLTADQALRIGLIEETFSSQELFVQVQEIMDKIIVFSRNILYKSKRAIFECSRDPYLKTIEDPSKPMIDSIQGKEFKEGTKAFLDKKGRG